MEIRMLETVLGTFHGNPAGVKRGDVVDIPEDWIAERYIVAGKATAKVTGEMPTAGESLQEAEALRAEVARKVRDSIPIEHRPVPGVVNFNRRTGQAVVGGLH